MGALDLYITPPQRPEAVDPADALTASALVTAALHHTTRRNGRRLGAPPWVDAPYVQHRSLVWQAIGVVSAGLAVPADDALSILRAHAYTRTESLDELAAELVSGEVQPEDMALDADGPGHR